MRVNPDSQIVSDTGPLISLEKLPDGYSFIRKLYSFGYYSSQGESTHEFIRGLSKRSGAKPEPTSNLKSLTNANFRIARHARVAEKQESWYK